jgi:Group II intron, maturase-specific domain
VFNCSPSGGVSRIAHSSHSSCGTARARPASRPAPPGPQENRGWAAYYRGVVSSRLFGSLDDYLWHLTHKWATWGHNNKPKRWIVGRYFGKFRNDHWVFGDRDSGAYLVKFSWTAIQRHVPVKGAASPDDPALASYWAERRKKVQPPLDGYSLRLLFRQDGAARSAATTSSAPTSHPSPLSSGNGGGCRSPARR